MNSAAIQRNATKISAVDLEIKAMGGDFKEFTAKVDKSIETQIEAAIGLKSQLAQLTNHLEGKDGQKVPTYAEKATNLRQTTGDNAASEIADHPPPPPHQRKPQTCAEGVQMTKG